MPELREALESAIQQSEAATPETVPEATASAETTPEPAEENKPAAESASVPTDDKPELPTVEKTDDDAPKKEAVAGEQKKPETEEERRQHRIDRAPQSWKKEAKGEWAALPLHVRQEIHKREADITRTLNQTAPDRQLAEQFKQTVQPFMARIQANGVNPLQAVEGLFKADLMLATASKGERAKYMADLIKQYDVDIEALDNALVGAAQPQSQQSPDIAALVQQQLQQALAPILQREQQTRQQAQQQVEQTVEQMALNPDYPYFDDVREDMADVIEINAKRGVAISLEEAYSRAVRMNPETVGLMERQSTMQTAEQRHLQAQRAKVAASSVTGAPAGAGGQMQVGDGSLRGAIEAAFSGQRI
jgi:hypothetical protein